MSRIEKKFRLYKKKGQKLNNKINGETTATSNHQPRGRISLPKHAREAIPHPPSLPGQPEHPRGKLQRRRNQLLKPAEPGPPVPPDPLHPQKQRTRQKRPTFFARRQLQKENHFHADGSAFGRKLEEIQQSAQALLFFLHPLITVILFNFLLKNAPYGLFLFKLYNRWVQNN